MLTTEEQWIPIEATENKYEISSFGRVRDCNGNNIKPIYTRGYYVVNFPGRFKKGLSRLVHRLVAGAFLKNPDNKPFVNHIDSHPGNNNLSNLEWCTHKENMAHGTASRIKRGERGNYKTKLNGDIVLEIRNKYLPNKYTSTDLAKEYGLNRATIIGIIARKSWKHVPVSILHGIDNKIETILSENKRGAIDGGTAIREIKGIFYDPEKEQLLLEIEKLKNELSGLRTELFNLTDRSYKNLNGE